MWPDLRKPDIIAHFKFHFITFLYLNVSASKVLALHSKIFEVTALQSSRNGKINFYIKYRENKLKVLIRKTDLTYEWSDAQTGNLHHHTMN